MNVNALRHCRRRKARTVFSDPQLTGLEKRFENQRYTHEKKITLKLTILLVDQFKLSLIDKDHNFIKKYPPKSS